MNGDRIELHPEVQRLLEEIAVLRDELAARLAELHELQHVVKPCLLAIYQSKLGPWELRLLQAQCLAARLRRKAELVQAALNRGHPPDLAAIELALELEFLTWQQRMQEAAREIEAAQFRLSHVLSDADAAALKKLYRTLVKKLHPDLNPGQTAEQSNLWLQAVAAYESSDLDRLKTLELLAKPGGGAQAAPKTLEETQNEHGRLRRQVMQLYGHLAELEKLPPFSMRRLWEDEDWVAKRREELETQTAAANEQAKALESHLAALLAIHGSGQPFGLN